MRLSRDSSVSCATCHDPQYAFTDARKLRSASDRRTSGDQRVPRLLNRATGRLLLGWARGQLEEQVVHADRNPQEMDLPTDRRAARVAWIS